MKRELAWRVFASEFNDTTLEQTSEEDMAPSYVITPLGAKINRLYLVGVLTDVENIGESGDVLRAHISDPTGVFTVYAGQFQPEVAEQLDTIEVPAFVALVGKARTYEPEEGTLLVSIRPESITEVSTDIRDQWILETCQQTKDRVSAMVEARQMPSLDFSALKDLGFPLPLCEGIIQAVEHYPEVDFQKYIAMIRESLQYLGPKPAPTYVKKEEPQPMISSKRKKPIEKKTAAKETSETSDDEDVETTVFDTIKQVEGEEGAPWDDIVKQCEKQGLDETAIEEALTSLMDKGMVYEPILGTIKTT